MTLLQQSEQPQHMNEQIETPVITQTWMPSQVRADDIEHIQSLSKIRKVGFAKTKSHDILGRLRTTRLGQIYRNHLKQYYIIRWLAQWIWRIGYPVYVNQVSTRLYDRKAKRWRSLARLSEFAKNNGVSIYKLADAVSVETPEPRVFPTSDQGLLISPHERYTFPETYVAIIKNATVYGGTNLVLAEDNVVCHDLYDFERDYTSEELHNRTHIDPRRNRIRWLLHDDEPEPIAMAATFVDACAANYAHWMTEVLPRVMFFCTEERFKGVPIVVNDRLHNNIMESLALVAGPDREIITLPTGRALFVNKLYLSSVTGYVPFERRSNKLTGHSHGLFSPRAFEKLRNYMNVQGQKIEEETWPDKIFLRRNSGARKVINTAKLEKLIQAGGFVIVEPEKLTFLQQVQLFSNAKVIVGSSGAALANLIFCPQGAKIFILISKYPDTSYWYWQNIACASGQVINYVLGEISTGNFNGIHADYIVKLDGLMSWLEKEVQ